MSLRFPPVAVIACAELPAWSHNLDHGDLAFRASMVSRCCLRRWGCFIWCSQDCSSRFISPRHRQNRTVSL